MERAAVTLTPLDRKWLRTQVASALAAAPADPSTPVQLPRSTVETLACVLDAAPAATPSLASRYHISIDELRPAVIAEMVRLASSGVAPSKSRWDAQRQRELPTAQHICRVLDCGWPVLALAAGLELSPHARRFATDSEPAPAGDDDAPTADDDDPEQMPVVRVRTEVVERGNQRITRHYHELR